MLFALNQMGCVLKQLSSWTCFLGPHSSGKPLDNVWTGLFWLHTFPTSRRSLALHPASLGTGEGFLPRDARVPGAAKRAESAGAPGGHRPGLGGAESARNRRGSGAGGRRGRRAGRGKGGST